MRFGRLDIAYDHRVLEPRPWTAAQSLWANGVLRDAPPGPVLELCSGAGHIGLLAILGTGRRLVAVDADAAACEFGRRNAAAAGLADQVEVRHATLDAALAPDELFSLIIADPPWVPSERTVEFPEDPLPAIDGGPDGLAVARQCVEVAEGHLAPGGAMLLQLGSVGQAEALDAVVDELAPSLVIGEIRRPGAAGVLVRLNAAPRTH